MWVKQIQCLEASEVERAAVIVATMGEWVNFSSAGEAGRGCRERGAVSCLFPTQAGGALCCQPTTVHRTVSILVPGQAPRSDGMTGNPVSTGHLM